MEEAFNYRLAPLGYHSIEEFIAKKNGSDRAPFEEKQYEKIGFATPTGKVELYSTILDRLGYDPLPRYEEPTESPSNTELAKEFPLILITGGRHLPFYHSEHRQIDSLRKMHPEPLVQINPKTASELGISDGDWVRVRSRRGEVRVRAQVDGRCREGVVFMTFHFAEALGNVLTNPALDPVAKIPEYKACAVRIDRVLS